MDEALHDGAYDRLITHDLLRKLEGLQVLRSEVEEEEAADVLGQHLGRMAAQHLASLPHGQRVDAANRLLALLDGPDPVLPGPESLLAAARQVAPGVWRLLQQRPQVPLSRPALLTNSHGDPKLGAELRAELATADRVDLLCAFVKWYGLRVLETELRQRHERGVPLRVLTTTYLGATDRTALDRLVRDFGAHVKVNYETQSTRLHAKAWLFRRLTGFDAGRDLTLLFVAHRKEILEQSLRTYREVLADASFGELYVGGEHPERWRHVFASVQSLSAYGVEHLPAEHFDVVVIDEFHHAEARTYRRLLERLEPAELLGLTATPERSDGIDVRSFFHGRTAAELRLWDALEADLLSPFHYFGVADPTDLSSIEWRRGDYDTSALERVFTADDARLRVVLKQLRDKVVDALAMRALGFCVSVGHAQYMARRFTEAGIPARAVSGTTSAEDRASALRALRGREVNVLFAVDLFNEGLDVPEVDTLLLLRPTQSATVFLQQLGRGLRRTPDKPVLTVLDFIGQQRREFRFDLRYRALTGTTRAGLVRQLEQGFSYLPSGCELVLDSVAQRTVLENVRRQLGLSRKELVAEVRNHGDLDLATWLRESGRELADVYRSRNSWTALRRAAGKSVPEERPGEDKLLHRVGALTHVDDAERAMAYNRLLQQPFTYDVLSEREQRFARMLFFSLWPNGGGHDSYQAGFDALQAHAAVRDELQQVVALGLAHADHIPLPLEAGLQQVTMRTHASYSREEVLAALDWASLTRTPSSFVAGVVWSDAVQTDAFFVTLRKTEREYSPTTMYRDHALSHDLFHWESQNATSVESTVGQRYLSHRERGSHAVLFARQSKRNDWGGPLPFTCLGPADYVSHVGDRPIAITWRLRHPLTSDLYLQASLTA